MMKPTCKTRKDKDGQRGIISTLEFNPDYSGAYAAGSYAHSISVYAENARDSVLELDMAFGVTCLKWSPCGCQLWAGESMRGEQRGEYWRAD
jgi:telomerase Cajal body protein 1